MAGNKEMRLEYVCVEPDVGEKLLTKYYGVSRKEIRENPDIFSLEEKEVLARHIRVCRKCEQYRNVLREIYLGMRYIRQLIKQQVPDYKNLPPEEVLKKVHI